jgi:hemerythrin-like domain-containing protein
MTQSTGRFILNRGTGSGVLLMKFVNSAIHINNRVMKSITQKPDFPGYGSRRNFIRKGGLLVATAGVAGISGLAISCANRSSTGAGQEGAGMEGEEEMVSATEDLMREHGLLQRMMLIYDAAIGQISEGHDFNPDYIRQTAAIIHNFIEDYHEKLEEEHVFPRLEEANVLTDLTGVLRNQHQAGRKVTERILGMTGGSTSMKEDELRLLMLSLRSFNQMYRPHESREETVLFPAFKEVVSEDEYADMGEEFEKIEHQKFGGDGFDMMVDRVAEIEKQIGIYDIDQFTPVV